MKTVRRLAFVGLLALAVAGCGGGPKLVPVTGRVVMADGTPVTAASICFTPDPSKGNNEGILATSLLNLDGSFTLTTHPHGDGAMVGTYKVTVSLGRAANTKSLMRYTQLKDTPLTLEVPAEGLKDYTITLQ